MEHKTWNNELKCYALCVPCYVKRQGLYDFIGYNLE
jgi:hypothetical protein